jgi:hypothetical protein
VVFCFARPEDAQAFCERFSGERLTLSQKTGVESPRFTRGELGMPFFLQWVSTAATGALMDRSSSYLQH